VFIFDLTKTPPTINPSIPIAFINSTKVPNFINDSSLNNFCAGGKFYLTLFTIRLPQMLLLHHLMKTPKI